jgi:hypothetical protein
MHNIRYPVGNYMKQHCDGGSYKPTHFSNLQSSMTLVNQITTADNIHTQLAEVTVCWVRDLLSRTVGANKRIPHSSQGNQLFTV